MCETQRDFKCEKCKSLNVNSISDYCMNCGEFQPPNSTRAITIEEITKAEINAGNLNIVPEIDEPIPLRMTEKARGIPYESFKAAAWTDRQLIACNYAVDASGEPHPHEETNEEPVVVGVILSMDAGIMCEHCQAVYSERFKDKNCPACGIQSWCALDEDLEPESVPVMKFTEGKPQPDLLKEAVKIPFPQFKIKGEIVEPKLSRYHREIKVVDKNGKVIQKRHFVDVYALLQAFSVTDQAIGHAIKKLIDAGNRGVKSTEQDYREAIQSINGAINLL